ncbi:MAG: urease accessory protein [Alphaproteobacteria bacterium]
MLSILLLGLVMGMQHAIEADHVAAVASIAAGERSPRRIVAHGVVWGAGHAVTLLVFVGLLVVLGGSVPPALADALEFAVGVLLVGFGVRVLVRLIRDRVHFHVHRHGDGQTHLHAHSHAGESRRHDPASHRHHHPPGLPLQTFLVGVMHGLAGSAALLMLTATTVGSPGLSIGYVAVFGLGSIAGMAALSACIAVPLGYAARALTLWRNAVEGCVGAGTIALGLWICAGYVMA